DLPPSDARSRLEVRVVTCLNLLDRADDVIQEAERILEYETNPHRRRILLLNLSWELMQLGRAPEAFSAIEGAIQLAEETGFEYDAWQCRAQRAAFLHLQGRSEEAIPILQEAVDHLREADQGRVDRDALTIETNLALALVEVGRREEATDRLSRLRAAALPHGLNEVLALCEPALGLCLAHDRRPAEAAQVLIAGLRSAYRTSHGSAVEAVGCSAEALALWGSPEAAGLAEAWHDLAAGRRRILHAPSRNRAEALGLAGRTPHPPADLLQVVRETTRALGRHHPLSGS
ncbi:MAG: hypothetical protein MH204_02150, partial [Fimbriimonadaceae bacterium]|nr:hypothetical protein [Fimbriimonadaceae bacterium]